MSWRTTIVLACPLVIVAAILWIEGPAPIDKQPFEDAPPRPTTQVVRHLVEIAPAEVIRVRITRNGETRVAERTGSVWRGATNSTAVNDFLQNLTQLGILMDIPSGPAELTDFGLQPPQSEVQLQLRDDNMPFILEIGNRNPATTGVYVRRGSSAPVVLAGVLLAWEVDKAFNAIEPLSTRE